MKRTFLIYLMLCLITPITIEAKKKPFGNGLYWELDNGILTISGNGNMPDFEWTYKKGYQSPWFKELKKKLIRKVVIEEGVTSICKGAFVIKIDNIIRTSSINEVSFPSTLRKIGAEAFRGATIKNLKLNDGLESIGFLAFGENKIEELIIPNSVKELGGGECYLTLGFNHWTKLSGRAAFGNKIQRVKLSSNIKTIPEGLFFECHELTDVEIPQGIIEIEDGAFLGSGIKNIIIPNSVKKIGRMSFANCKNLISLSIPNNIEHIDRGVFLLRGATKTYRMRNNDVFDYIEDKYWDGAIYNLPDTLTERNCEDFGISENAVIRYLKGENGIVNSKGKIILQAKTGRIAKKIYIGNEMFPYYQITEGAYTSLMNDNGKWIVPLEMKCSELLPVGDNFIKVKYNGYYGITTLEGKEIISPNRNYTSIGNYNSNKGTFAFTRKGYIGICDILGREISTTKLASTSDDIKTYGGYTSATAMNNGSTNYFKVCKGGRYGLTDSEGKEIVPCEMEALESAGSGYLKYKLNGFWGVMNYTGKIIIDTNRGYTSIGDFKTFNKRFAYTMTGYKGECDATGRQISKIKVATQTTPNSTTTTPSTTTTTTKPEEREPQRVIIEHQHTPQPMQEWQQCTSCWGSGNCRNCAGSGTTYIGSNLHRCTMCGGRGRCTTCSGQGGKYITVYR